MNSRKEKPCVCVMLASYNGEKFIQEQIDSILRQEGVIIKLVIRDDGSKDDTLQIIDKYSDNESIQIVKGQNLGPANNFYKLLGDACEADFYAWSDQDDIWDADKLSTAVSKIAKVSSDKPALYYSASRTVDSDKKTLSIIGTESPSLTYGAALIRSKAQGATFVFNNALMKIARLYTPEFKKCAILHDAWLHRVCLAVDGVVVHDSTPHMSYRIHGNNVLAKAPSNKLKDRLATFFSVNTTNYCSKVANQLLIGYGSYMPKNNYQLTYDLANYRDQIASKMRIIFSSKYKVGVLKEDIKFKMSVLLNRA
ncbi:glycosyltransferase family 2 protein [Anaerovoracaceae bacterium Sow4_D4]